MNKFKLLKNISRGIAYVFVILSLWQTYSILHGFNERNKDNPNFNFWSLQEDISYNHLTGEGQDIIDARVAEQNTFKLYCFSLILFAGLFEYFKYKADPILYKKNTYNNWFNRTIRKIQEHNKKNYKGDEQE